jgi:hypothetical protein
MGFALADAERPEPARGLTAASDPSIRRSADAFAELLLLLPPPGLLSCWCSAVQGRKREAVHA